MLLRFAADEFLDEKELQNLAEWSVNHYRKYLDEFMKFCEENEVLNVQDVKPNLIKSFLSYCKKERKNAPATLNTKLKHLKVFFNYLEKEDIIDPKNNPIKDIKPIKFKSQKKPFSDYHIRQMLNYYKRSIKRRNSFTNLRNYVLLLYLLGTGARLNEFRNAKWEDIDFEKGTIYIYGKRDKAVTLPLTQKLQKEIAYYKSYCKQYFGEVSEFIFVDKNNKQLSKYGAQSIFKRLNEAMNFKDLSVNCHRFRHTFAINLVKQGCDAFTLQCLLRHEDISISKNYVNIYGTNLKEQNEKYNPLNHLDI
ncbi:tyrosine-type recombinase/integrase [Natranaerofaba carboxydovora]|uniref:tyrosine-type recombinase/integrase n=1 Tax=Natranaerofaba carboxydovora TaxID=2742683 RepID=UPI001F1408CB|nr:tyrosine-type recombinase/integrase [Natranaerofaba carboxydovora]UMZ72557.1 Tyrosine recombinase XerC [Natranaerofaba carboxydovora]